MSSRRWARGVRHKLGEGGAPIDNEDRWVDWLTYQNINDWNTRAKSFLVTIGMGTEDPGLIRKCFVCFIFCQHVTHSICSFECLFHFRRRREQDGSRP